MKNLHSILKLLILFSSLAVSSHAETDPFLQDDPFLSVDKDGLVQKKHRFGKDFIDDISRSGAVKLTAVNTPESIKHLVPEGHEVYDLKPFFSKHVKPHTFKDKEYILYDLTTGHLITSTIPEVTSFLEDYTRDKLRAKPKIIVTRLIFTSVKRPKDPFMIWTQKEISEHDPKLIVSAYFTTRSGEKAHYHSKYTNNKIRHGRTRSHTWVTNYAIWTTVSPWTLNPASSTKVSISIPDSHSSMVSHSFSHRHLHRPKSHYHHVHACQNDNCRGRANQP